MSPYSARKFVRGTLVRTKTEQCTDIPTAFELRVGANINDIRAAAKSVTDQRSRDIFQFPGLLATNGASGNHAGVEVPTMFALDGTSVEALPHHDGLNFAAFQ